MSPRLAFERQGKGERIVLVHGFTQRAQSWAHVATDLAAHFEVVCVDAPNHGASSGITAAGLGEAVRLVTDAGGTATYVGYSMGGRICLRAALDRPDIVRSLVLVSTTAGIEDGAERLRRRDADRALADRLDPPRPDLAPLPLRQFLAEWLAGPLFSTLGADATDLDTRLGNSPAGLARSLRTLGTGSMAPLWDRLGELNMPVLAVAGDLDEKFLALTRRMVALIGAEATMQVVAGAGHAVPFEEPGQFCAGLREFLTRADRS
jgi:2-succinyl-6-hydroxy-2,4-cyclohexadiene-1-carboxylate synthase